MSDDDSWWVKDGLDTNEEGNGADDAASIAADIGGALKYDSADPLAEVNL